MTAGAGTAGAGVGWTRRAYRSWGKRLLDLLLAGIAAPLWLPLVGILVLLVRANLGSPAFFRQRRAGRHGRAFEVVKLRTMTDQRGPDGGLLPDGERLTRLGRLLRASSLDELPELLNVLRGEMSLVGPRPLVCFYEPYYTERERTRFTVRPGITGLAQVSGRNYLGWDRRLELDAVYAESYGMWLDLRILVRTFTAVVRSEGAAADADAAEPWLSQERAHWVDAPPPEVRDLPPAPSLGASGGRPDTARNSRGDASPRSGETA